MKTNQIETPIGLMTAIANEDCLFLLEFTDQPGLDREIERLKKTTKSTINRGFTTPITSIQKELNLYFNGFLKEFKTPIFLSGSSFQKVVWEELIKTPFGETRSYSQLARDIGKPTAFRAVAQANGANQLAIIIPCHRIINANGCLGGYAGGVLRKKKLLENEKKAFFSNAQK